MTILSVDLFLIDLGMNFIPCDGLEIHVPEICLWNIPERRVIRRPKSRYREIQLRSQFLLLPYFQQLPYVSHPLFQLGNIGIVEMSGAVDAAADVVDIRGNPADSGG